MYFPNWAKNILFLLVYMISGLLLVILIEGLLTGADLIPFNTAIESAVVQIRAPLLTNFLIFVSEVGSPFVLTCLAAFAAAVLLIRGNSYDALLILTAICMAVVITTVLKNTFQITRPGSALTGVSGYSFPSGHATVATAFFFVIAHSFIHEMRTARMKAFLIVGSIVSAFLICFSRLYLGAHWALDILGGIAVGLLSVSFTVLVFSIVLGEGRWRIKRPSLRSK